MLRHILLPLDGSELAYKALEHISDLLPSGGEITLLSVLENVGFQDFYAMPRMPIINYEKLYDETRTHTQAYLTRIAETLREQGNLTVSVRVESGDPATTIIETAKARNVDAIVMSTHGRSGLSRWLFGSVTEKILVSGVCPVYVIPARADALSTQEMQAARQASAGKEVVDSSLQT